MLLSLCLALTLLQPLVDDAGKQSQTSGCQGMYIKYVTSQIEASLTKVQHYQEL
jgi:hypothetical protein